jgi:hypothetical protein
MTCEEILDQATAMLQRRGRAETYARTGYPPTFPDGSLRAFAPRNA